MYTRGARLLTCNSCSLPRGWHGIVWHCMACARRKQIVRCSASVAHLSVQLSSWSSSSQLVCSFGASLDDKTGWTPASSCPCCSWNEAGSSIKRAVSIQTILQRVGRCLFHTARPYRNWSPTPFPGTIWDPPRLVYLLHNPTNYTLSNRVID